MAFKINEHHTNTSIPIYYVNWEPCYPIVSDWSRYLYAQGLFLQARPTRTMAYLLLLQDVADHALRKERIFQDKVDLFAEGDEHLLGCFKQRQIKFYIILTCALMAFFLIEPSIYLFYLPPADIIGKRNEIHFKFWFCRRFHEFAEIP